MFEVQDVFTAAAKAYYYSKLLSSMLAGWLVVG